MTIQEYLSSLRGKTAAVLGIGVSNTPLIELLCRNGVQVIACDKKSREDLGERAEQLEALGLSISALQKRRRISEQVNYIMEATKQLLGRLFQKPAGQSNHLIELAKEFVNEHLPDPALDMALVSDHVGLSKIYFCRLFHKEEGVSFSNYLKLARIERAKQLLLQTNMKVFVISDAAGFSNAKYFGYVFKQEVGLTPLEFQKTSAHSHSNKENSTAK